MAGRPIGPPAPSARSWRPDPGFASLSGMLDPWLSTSGFAAGVRVGMTGVGGALMTPLPILLLATQPTHAVDTEIRLAKEGT